QRLRGVRRALGVKIRIHLVTPAFFCECAAHDTCAQATAVFRFAAAGERTRSQACARVIEPQYAAWDKALPSPFGQALPNSGVYCGSCSSRAPEGPQACEPRIT